MEQAKISGVKFCNSYVSSVCVDFENGDRMILYGDTDLTSFIVQAFSFNGANYSDCSDEKISKLVDYVTDIVNDDSDESHALFRGLIKIYLDFSRMKKKDRKPVQESFDSQKNPNL